jgi:hypothetical protein
MAGKGTRKLTSYRGDSISLTAEQSRHNDRQRKAIRNLAGFAAIETRALLDEFEQIGNLASDNGRPDYRPDTRAMHSRRLAAWGNVEQVKEALINLANEIDRMGD